MIFYTPTPSYDDFLAHHGIKGQKWGVRNGPPYPLDSSISTGKRLKNVGSVSKKKAKVGSDSSNITNRDKKDILKELEEYRYGETDLKKSKLIQTIANDESVKKAVEERLAADSEWDKYSKNRDYYASLAARVEAKKWDIPKDELDQYIKWYIYDDGDQGSINSYSVYLLTKGIDPNKYLDKLFDAEKAFDKSVVDAVAKTGLDTNKVAKVYKSGSTSSVGQRSAQMVRDYFDKELYETGKQKYGRSMLEPMDADEIKLVKDVLRIKK